MQSLLARALLAPQTEAAATMRAASGRFNVYRNTYLITLRNALRSIFPAVERLVGEEFFAALAGTFAEQHPPRSPIMARYGDAFPDFIKHFAALDDYPYLADVARLEFARVQAYHAADAGRFDVDGAESAMAALEHPVRWHPSVRVIASASPVHSIWQAQVDEHEHAPDDWLPETALVWRRGTIETVETMQIDAQANAMLVHVANGSSFAALLEDCADQQAATRLVTQFVELAAAGILVPASLIDHGENP
ncbi:DNA-binding domain-containing protein [Novosphingobium sp.]|uniref:HvfC/BufC N-terminal domain-containing protein n=1 Tax=Novosphingobium sp. TaxID=1874826 RepID=UPI003BA95F54